MDRRVIVGVVVGVGLLLTGVGLTQFVLGSAEDPGDCGLGTGGVWYAGEANHSIASSGEARTAVDRRFAANDSRFAALTENASRYAYVPRAELSDDFLDATFQRATYEDKFAREDTVYFFVPDRAETEYVEYDGTIAVTEDGTLYVVRAGGC